MAKRSTTTSYAMTVFKAALLTALCVLPGFMCEFDTTPKILRHPPVEKADDADSGDETK